MSLVLPSLPSGHVPNGTDYAQLLAATQQAYGLWAVKSTDQSCISTTTYQNVTDMTIAVEANSTYHMVLDCFYAAATSADIKLQFTRPGDVSMNLAQMVLNTGAIAASIYMGVTDPNTICIMHGNGAGVTGAAAHGRLDGIVRTLTAGVLQLQFAQLTSQAINATIFRDSYWRMWKQ
jgi:hypothetical protein